MTEIVKPIGVIEGDEDLRLPGLEPKVEIIPEVTGATGPAKPIEEPRPPSDMLEHDDDFPALKVEPTGPTGPPQETIDPEVTGSTAQPTGATGTAEEVEDDIFKLEEENKPPEELPKPDYDYKSLADELGLELEAENRDALKGAIQKAIDTAKTIVEPDLSKFNSEQKILFSWLHEGGTLEDFFSPLKAFDDFLLKPDDEKVMDYLVTEEELSAEAAKIKLDQIIEADQFDDYVEKVNELGGDLREAKYKEIIGVIKKSQEDRELQILSTATKEKAELAKMVDQTNEFLGFPIPQNVKDAMKRKIDSGKLTIENNNAQTQILGHYFTLFGNKIFQKLQGEIKDARDAGYNRGIRKVTERLHEAPTKLEAALGHGSRGPDSDAKPLDGFKDIDKDTKSGF